VLYQERYRASDEAFVGGGIVQAAGKVLIRAGRELRVWPQRDAFELPRAVRLLDLHAGGVVAVGHDDDASIGAKVQVPELMTGGERGDEQLAGFHRAASPRKTGSDEPAMSCLPGALISCARE